MPALAPFCLGAGDADPPASRRGPFRQPRLAVRLPGAATRAVPRPWPRCRSGWQDARQCAGPRCRGGSGASGSSPRPLSRSSRAGCTSARPGRASDSWPTYPPSSQGAHGRRRSDASGSPGCDRLHLLVQAAAGRRRGHAEVMIEMGGRAGRGCLVLAGPPAVTICLNAPGCGRIDAPGHAGKAALQGLRAQIVEDMRLEEAPLGFHPSWGSTTCAAIRAMRATSRLRGTAQSRSPSAIQRASRASSAAQGWPDCHRHSTATSTK